MSSVLLFRPAYDPLSRSKPVYPWGLVYLASVLVNRGVDVTIFDEAAEPNSRSRIVELLQEKKPLAVGISTMTGDQIRFGLEFAQLVRAHSPTAIVWGGIHPSLLPEQTARHPLVDYAVAGEGEYAFADLVDCLARGKDPCEIPGVYGERDGRVHGVPRTEFVDLAALPELPYELLDVEPYICKRPDLGAGRYFEVCTSRGCPHHCGFCYIESVHGSRWRHIEADAAVDRIKALVKRFSLDCVSFREDNFFVQPQRVERIARRLIDDRVGIQWAASCRINYFAKYSPEFVALLKESGCALLTFGVESGSDRVLDFVRKDITVEMVHRVAHTLKAAGIRSAYHFMGGFPTETTPEFLATCRLIDALRRLGPDIVVREMSVFAPYPGIGLLPECAARGYREAAGLEEWIDMDWANSRRPWLTEQQSRLISDAQFLIARLAHPNPVIRSWAAFRWRQMLNNASGITLFERPAIEWLKQRLHTHSP